MVRLILLLFMGILGLASAAAQGPVAPGGGAPGTTLDVRIDPFVNLHFLARQAADGQVEAPRLDGFGGVVEAVRELERAIGGPRMWLQFEGNISRCETADQAIDVFGGLPKTVTRGGEERPMQEPAVRYARALAVVEGAYLRDVWPAHRERLDKAREELASGLLARERECLDFVMGSLAMADPGVVIPVYLVVGAPRPGASTSPLRGGGAVCFVAREGDTPAQFAESVLHESIHALDIATAGQETALNRLRADLRSAGMSATDPRLRDFWHTVMFIQAAETIRRKVDPAHEHYGDSAGYYPKVAAVAELERPIWTDYLDGKLSLDQAIEKIVGGGVPSKP